MPRRMDDDDDDLDDRPRRRRDRDDDDDDGDDRPRPRRRRRKQANGLSPILIAAIAVGGVFAFVIVVGGVLWARSVSRQIAAQGPPPNAFPRPNVAVPPPVNDGGRPGPSLRPTRPAEDEEDDSEPSTEWNFVQISNVRIEDEHQDPRMKNLLGGQNRVLSFDWAPGPSYDKARGMGRPFDVLTVTIRSPDGVGTIRLDTSPQFGARGGPPTGPAGGTRTMSVQKFGAFRTFNTPVEVWVVKGKKRVSNRAVLN